jgi:hypothetical protein
MVLSIVKNSEEEIMVVQLKTIYQIKVTLKGTMPPIWRRFLTHRDIDLDKFHLILQSVMGWTNSHLHQFSSGSTIYSTPDDDFYFEMESEDESKYKLSDLLKKEKDWITYEYDFGDGWEHTILLEKILDYDDKLKIPKCIKGKRACPPEDCGGVWGYQNLLGVISNALHPEYEEMLEWLGGEFDPEEFDIEETNRILSEYYK